MTASTRAATNSAKTASSSTLAYPSTTTSYAILTRSAHLAAAAAATRTTRSSTAVKAAQTASTAAARRPTKAVHKSSPLAAIPSKRLPPKTTIPTPKTTIPPKKAASSIPPSPRAQRYDKRKRIAEETTEIRVPKRRRSSGRPATSAPIPSSSRITLDMDTEDDYLTASRAICSSSTCVVESTPDDDGTDQLTLVASSQQDDSHPRLVRSYSPSTILSSHYSDPNAGDSHVAQVSIGAEHSVILDPLSSTMDGDETLTSLPSDGDSDSSDDMLTETPDADGVFISHQPSTPASPLPSLPDITSYSFVTERPPTRLSPLSCSSFTSSHVQDQSSSTEADADGDIDMDSYNEIHEIEYEYVPERRHKPDPDLWRFTCRHRVGYITAVYGRKLIRELVEEEASRVGWRDYRDEEAYDFELDESDEEDVEWQNSQEMAAEPEMIVFSASPSPEPSLQGQGPPTPFPASSTEPSLSWPPPKLGSVRVPDIWGFGEDWRVRGTPVDHARRSVWASPPAQHFTSDLRSSSPQLYTSQDGYGRYESSPPTSPPLQTFVPSYAQPLQHFSPPSHPPPACLPQDNYAHSQHQLFDGNAEAASTSFPLPIDPVMLDQFIERLAANKFEMPEDGSGFMSPVGVAGRGAPGDGNVIYSVGGAAGAVESFTEMLYAAEEAF